MAIFIHVRLFLDRLVDRFAEEQRRCVKRA
jgi:hypothetical protein